MLQKAVKSGGPVAVRAKQLRPVFSVTLLPEQREAPPVQLALAKSYLKKRGRALLAEGTRTSRAQAPVSRLCCRRSRLGMW
jgi:hypothetical protein